MYIYIYIHAQYICIIYNTQSAQAWQKQDEHNTYIIMKATCPPVHYQNGFVATQVPGHVIYGRGGRVS